MAYALLKLRQSQAEAAPVTEVNIIPVIDISLVLLVILFVTAPLLSYPNYPVELPRAAAKEAKEKTVTVTYTKDGRMAVASDDVSPDKLEAAIAGQLERTPGAAVVLRVDKNVPYRTVQSLILAAKSAGAQRVALATEKRE
ncbi:MAG: biopolymer transporter ExbD [Elusimicrobiota bacterium]